jgi:hypothetical protein
LVDISSYRRQVDTGILVQCPLRSYLPLLQTAKKTAVFRSPFQLISSLINKASEPSTHIKSHFKAVNLGKKATVDSWQVLLKFGKENQKCSSWNFKSWY